MNWEMIGALGELLGAVVVVGSIVYLASQVRHNTAVARSDVGRELAARFSELNQGIATDERLPAFGPDGERLAEDALIINVQ